MTDEVKKTTSGIKIPVTVTSDDIATENVTPQHAGEYPYTRGVYPNMYRGRFWTMRQYAGFGTAAETNKRFKYLIEKGQTGLSVAFDLATQIGYDSNHKMAAGEVGRTGVAIDSLKDMETLFDGIPLDKVSTSMTINSPAVILLAMYIAVGKKQGVPQEKLIGTIQNDVLKEFIARGTYIFPPGPSMKIITDIFEYAGQYLPRYNTISISGYHIREAGATAVQEVAFTLSNAIAYVEAALKAGLDIDKFAPRLSFFFAVHNDLFEEVAKFRAARTIWAKIMKEKFGAKSEKSMLLRFHTQTGGSTLTAQQPKNNIVRTTVQALAAAFGGTQSLHTNSFDEALALPSEQSAEIALRTQQLLAYESGITNTVDPLAGSYYVEYLTSQIQQKVVDLMDETSNLGGSVRCIESGYFADEIAHSAYEHQKRVESDETVVIGVNRFISEDIEIPNILKLDPQLENNQVRALDELRRTRNQKAVNKCLKDIADTADKGDNIVKPVLEAVEQYVTVGEISDVFRKVWGEYVERS
ncbi:MAG: methylmalonyl-CoA mutase family protein [candidate division Zixibacteria bacterium]|nr:methylmalonyl-CoA mutase family protein [candidate division Zixibacteria bacterium]